MRSGGDGEEGEIKTDSREINEKGGKERITTEEGLK